MILLKKEQKLKNFKKWTESPENTEIHFTKNKFFHKHSQECLPRP